MDTPETIPEANGQSKWPAADLNFAVMELRREFPKVAPERIVKAVELAARTLAPQAGRVSLLQLARVRL